MATSPTSPDPAGLPVTSGPVRFAVGSPEGSTSNSWRFWTTPAGDAYLLCRDNFSDTKVSLHASGRWRMAFTQEAVDKDPTLVEPHGNRAWEVWDEPQPIVLDAVLAFRLVFPTPELAVQPHQREVKKWRDTIFIEAAPSGSGKLTVVSLIVTPRDKRLTHGSEVSFTLATLPLGENRSAHLVAHGEPEGETPARIDDARAAAKAKAAASGVDVPEGGYFYFFGKRSDGARFITGARAHPPD